jgi:hypothetical protein
MTTLARFRYAGHQFPPKVISYAIRPLQPSSRRSRAWAKLLTCRDTVIAGRVWREAMSIRNANPPSLVFRNAAFADCRQPDPAEACFAFPVGPVGRLRGTGQADANHPDRSVGFWGGGVITGPRRQPGHQAGFCPASGRIATHLTSVCVPAGEAQGPSMLSA